MSRKCMWNSERQFSTFDPDAAAQIWEQAAENDPSFTPPSGGRELACSIGGLRLAVIARTQK